MAQGFTTADYVVFALMLLVSAGIGVWYGCGPGAKQTSTEEYLLAGRSMRVLPVAISMLVSFLSAITLLGVPAEVYTYGAQYYVLILSYFLVCGTAGIVFAPMFRRLRVTSANEVMYLSVALYAPSLALEAVAKVPLTVSILATGAVCTFYTTLGGLKAVIWTDVFQCVVMVGGLVTVAVKGSMEVGGLSRVWEINKDFGRLNFFDFNPDPRVRNTVWSLTLGGTLAVLGAWTVSQAAVQRFLAVKSLKEAKRAIWLNIPGLIFVVTLCTLDGLVVFAVYSGCDLKLQGKVTSNDQVLPYFVIDHLGHLTGLPGLFMACICAAALSTVSSAMNGVTLLLLEDIIKKKVRDLTDRDATRLSKVISVAFGVIVVAGAFSIRHAGAMVLQLAYSIGGILGAPKLGMFILGMFFRRANSKGAYTGAILGAAVATWVFIGSRMYPPNNYPGLRSIQQCKPGAVSNATLRKYPGGLITNPHVPHSEGIADFYSISYLWYSGLSMGTSVVFGIIASLITETKEDRARAANLDPQLLFPLKDWFMGFLPGHKFEWDVDEPEEGPAGDRAESDDVIGLTNVGYKDPSDQTRQADLDRLASCRGQ